MDCQTVKEEILASFEAALPAEVQHEVDRHLLTCSNCRAFAARQKNLDARLMEMLVLPAISSGFRTELRRQIRHETRHLRRDSLLEVVHFASCGVATLLCVVVLPFTPSQILIIGASAATLTYIPLAAIRNLLSEVEEAGQ